MDSIQRTTVVGLVLATCLVSAAIAETRKEFRFTVGAKANISVDTLYGAITVKPGSPRQVIVVALIQSDKCRWIIRRTAAGLKSNLVCCQAPTGKADAWITS